MTKENNNNSHEYSSEQIEKFLDRAYGDKKYDEDYADQHHLDQHHPDQHSPDQYDQTKYKFDFPCSAEQADKMMRKYDNRQQRLIKMLNDEWESWHDTRQDAVRYIIWSACFYIGNDPEKMLKIFRDLDPDRRDNRTELYDQWSGNHEDVKRILKYKYQERKKKGLEFYAYGESDDD